MAEWQPIETAPKDVRILLFRSGEQFVGSWMGMPWNTWGVCSQRIPGQWEAFTDVGRHAIGFENGSEHVYWEGPTHWMPLPPPPSAGRG